MKHLTRDEMEAMIGEYVLNQLSPDESATFEHNLPHYPDIQKECEDAKLVFSKMDEFDMDRAFGTRRAGAIQFIESSLRRQRAPFKGNRTFRFAIPFALIITFFIFYSNSKKNNTSNTVYSPTFIDYERGISKSELDEIYQSDFDTLTDEEIMQLFEGEKLSYPAILEMLEEMNYEQQESFFDFINNIKDKK